MAEWEVQCPECKECYEWRIGDRGTVTCVACGCEKTLEWVQGQQEGF